jgi:hydrogenase maturation factor
VKRVWNEFGLTNVALKKVCPMKDEVPIGDVVYEKDGYAIHKIDGEEHKVCMALYYRSFDHRHIGS